MTFELTVTDRTGGPLRLARTPDAGVTALCGSGPGVRLAVRARSAEVVRQAEGPGGWCVVVGSPIHTGPDTVDRVVERAVAGGPPSEVLSGLDGAFVAFALRTDGELTVMTDPLGLQTVYRARSAGRTVYGSSVAGTRAAAGLAFEEDLAATGSLLLIGHMVGDRTPAAGVRRVGPAALVRHRGTSEVERVWWRLPTDVDAGAPLREHADAIGERLSDWYHASHRAYGAGTFFASGGYDSRLTAALLLAHGRAPRALSIRHRDENADADSRVGRAVARAVGVRPSVIDPPRDYFDGADYADYLERTEALTPSLFLFIATIALARSVRDGAAWDGLLPGFLNVAPYECGGFGPYLAYLVGGRGEALRASPFRRDWLEAALAAARGALDEEVARWPDTPAGVLGFGLRNRARHRFAPNPIAVLGADGPVHLPGATRAFWECVSRTPTAQRAGGRVHVELIERWAPLLNRLPVVSGPAMLPAPRGRAPDLAALWIWATARAERAARHGRLQGPARTLGLNFFDWGPSTRALGAVRRALDDSAVHDAARAVRLVSGRDAVCRRDRALLPLVHRQRALEAASSSPPRP